MNKEYYSSKIVDFLRSDIDSILGQLLINDEFETTDLQKNAWRKEIEILKDQLSNYDYGEIAFEYTIPRIGHRIDAVCIISGIIFLIEFKVGEREHKKAIDDQVMDYALDLKYFHEKSRNRIIAPISLPTKAAHVDEAHRIMEDRIYEVIHCNNHDVSEAISDILGENSEDDLSMSDWLNSRYAPTPTIIEASKALYRSHSVKEISRNDAGAQNLTDTTNAINNIVDSCKKNKKKAICFVTGVPGAGKTLAGLNIANERRRFDTDEHAVFLSGNGPLVDVLQEALARDKANRESITKATAKRETKAFIQIIHKFRDEALTSDQAPIEKVVIFDEAQRAWNEEALSNFMSRKKGIPDFNQSEPEFLIGIMDRHQDWATIICLVGGGQEIYTGEAGIEEWFHAFRNKYHDWEIYLSDRMTDSEYIGNSSIVELLSGVTYNIEPSLHLGISLRSFRSEKLAEFTKEVLDNNPGNAASIYSKLVQTYPILLTRDLDSAKKWVRNMSRGTERYGLLASSEGKRLRGEGIWVSPEINHVGWFLNGKDYVDSSYYLEVAASEFEVQGLEIDYGLLAWDLDLRRESGDFDYYRFRGKTWNHINMEQRQKYLKNAYRVLLTRARQGLIIYVPKGTANDVDPTRDAHLYDAIYYYLRLCGIRELCME